MRKYIAICLLAMGFALNTTAQYVNGTAATKASQELFKERYADWDEVRLTLERNPYRQPDVRFGFRIVDIVNTTTSVHFSYRHGFMLSQKKPFFLETGIGMKWGRYNEEFEDWTVAYTGVRQEILNIWTVEIPLNVGYRFNKTGSNWSFYPYIGIYMRMHIAGNVEEQDTEGNKISANVFDRYEFYPTFESFQYGWQSGCNIQYRHFVFGWSYGIDFNKVWKNTRVSTYALNFGYRF